MSSTLIREPHSRESDRPSRPAGDPAWARPALVVLLAATALLYLWRLGDSGYANSFYSAAVQASTKSWKAFFFGSFDSSNFITVDKPPASLWVMDLSARIFGVNAWSILVPQALEGVAAVGLLYAIVRRYAGAAAGLIAGAVLALTPVAVLMFRFNNPDSLLTLLLVGSAYTLLRALEHGSTRWLLATSAILGTAFLTKMAQALIVIPVFAVVYLLVAPTPVRRRLWQLAAAAGTLVVASGWWVAIVALVPASARPYIGGSQDNSLLNLIFGYNGFGRLTGNETGSVGGGPAGAAGRWGATGWTRLFGSDMGTQISWLLPTAIILGAAILWSTRRRPRTDLTRAAGLVFAGWLGLTGVIFSFAQGIIHPYYTVALAPPIAGLVGIGAVICWLERSAVRARAGLAAATLAAGAWGYVLLDRTPSFHPELRVLVLAGGVVAAAALLGIDRLRGRIVVAVATLAIAASVGGSAAYALETASTPHSGAIPTAGPSTSGFPGAGRSTPPTRGQAQGGIPGAGGGFGGTAPQGPAQGGLGTGRLGTRPGGKGAGGLLDASSPSGALTKLLETDASSYRWAAATVGANQAAGYQLATGDAVMAIGGFNGSDPTPTLAQFKAYVRQGAIHYFIAGGTGAGSGQGTSGTIAAWVAQHFASKTVGGVTVYDLTQATGTA
jgi:4-amino-4-deoxy-L-arabinose transferase-like glycosyltransferase